MNFETVSFAAAIIAQTVGWAALIFAFLIGEDGLTQPDDDP